MTVAYWIVAVLLALFFVYAGGIKVVQSKEKLRPMMAWVDSMPLGLVRAIGVLEVLGAAGLILPPLTGIAAWLALVSAIGLVLIQIAGLILHVSRGEAKVIGLNIGLIVMGGIAAWLATVDLARIGHRMVDGAQPVLVIVSRVPDCPWHPRSGVAHTSCPQC